MDQPRTGIITINKASGTVSAAYGTTDLAVFGFKQLAGTFNAPTGNLFIGGYMFIQTIFSHTGGTFNHNNGTVVFDPSGYYYTVAPSSSTLFYNITSKSPNYLQLTGATDTLRVNNNLKLEQGGFYTGVLAAKGKVTVNSGWTGGSAQLLFCGASDQDFDLTSATGLYNGNIKIKKPSGKVNLLSAAVLDQSSQTLTFVKGNIATSSTNLLTIGHGVTISGASDSSYVDGPVKKIGTASFSFPTGKNDHYRRIAISAPSVSTDAYTAEYFEANPDPTYDNTSKDVTLNSISESEYWMLNRNAGSSNVSVTLGWKDMDCLLPDTSNMSIAAWDGSQWKDKGGIVTGDASGLNIVTSGTSNTYGPYAIANLPLDASWHGAGNDKVTVAGDSVEIGLANDTDWEYLWYPATNLDDETIALPMAAPDETVDYALTATALYGCEKHDTMRVYVTIVPEGSETNGSQDFITNGGQVIDTDEELRPDIFYYTTQTMPALYARENSMSFVRAAIDTIMATDDTLQRVDVKFENTVRDVQPLGLGLNTWYYNYFLAHCPQGVTHTPSYQRIVYPELYENTDLHVSGNGPFLKYEFMVKPGGNPYDITMTFAGADSITLSDDNDTLYLHSTLGDYALPRPRALKIDSTGNTVVFNWQPAYTLSLSGDTVRFDDIGPYDEGEVLVIKIGETFDITEGMQSDNLEWCTYYGGQRDDYFVDMSVIDVINNVCVAGTTRSYNFPIDLGQIIVQSGIGGGVDCAIVNFYPESSVNFATFLGGSGDEAIPSITTDTDGNVYLAGVTHSADFPAAPIPPSGAYLDDQFDGTVDLFVAKIKYDGTELLWRTFYGGDDGEVVGGTAIALDNLDNLYVTTNSDANQTLVPLGGAYNNSTAGGSVILKFDGTLDLVWATLFSDANTFIGDNIAIDNQNNLIITGNAQEDLVTVDPGGSAYFDGSYNSTGDPRDIFIAKFNSSNDLIWSTYYGGINTDFCNAITTDEDDTIYLGCVTSSYNIETHEFTGGYFDNSSNNLPDIFLMKFSSENERLWATFYGDGNDNADYVSDVTVTPSGQLFYCGYTNSLTNFEILGYNNYYLQSAAASNVESFYLNFTSKLEHKWTTYFGGSNIEIATAVDHVEDSRLYGVGYTQSSQLVLPKFPVRQYITDSYWQPVLGDVVGTYMDGFIAMFDIYELVTGLDETENDAENDLLLFPNPAGNSINLLFDAEAGEAQVTLYDVSVKTIYTKQLINTSGHSNIQLDITGLSKGLYFVQVVTGEKTLVRKFLKY